MINVTFESGRYEAYTDGTLKQWDYGQLLCINGLKLPDAIEIQFSAGGSEAARRVGVTEDGVTKVIIPDCMLEQSSDVTAFIYLIDATSGQTIYKVVIPVTARPKPAGWTVPDAQSVFRDALSQLNTNLTELQKVRDSAKASADDAAESARQAKTSEENALTDISNARLAALEEISSYQTAAIMDVVEAQDNAVEAVKQEKTAAVKAVDAARDEGLQKISDLISSENTATIEEVENYVIGGER